MNKVKNINIIHIDRNGYNSLYCFDDCIATIAARESIDYQFMYMDMERIVFDYKKANKEKKVIEGLLLEKQDNKQYFFLENMHGLKIKDYYELSQEQVMSIIRTELMMERVVLVCLDSYYCEWDVLYQKEHSKHLGLCIGLDRNKVLLCDPFYGLNSIEMDIQSFIKANYGSISTYQISNNSKKISQSCKDNVLNEYINKHVFEKRINNLTSFANAYAEIFNYETEYSDFDEALNSFDIILDIVIKTSRFYNLLKYIKPVNDNIQCLMDEVVGSLVVVKNMLFKGFFKRKDDVGVKIQKRILEIVEKEKTIFDFYYNDIYEKLKYLDMKDTEFVADFQTNDRMKNVIVDTVDISGILNNNSFGDYKDKKCEADFTGLKEFLQYENIDNNIKVDDNIIVYTHISPKNAYDNLVCEGQNIEVNTKNKYERIGILSVSEFGESIDVIKLVYADGIQQKLHIKVTDVNAEPLFGEKIVWRGVTYQKDDNGNTMQRLDNAHLFWIEFKINSDCSVKKIVLPDCSNLHIYGIYFFK